jgi:hypothetical protein
VVQPVSGDPGDRPSLYGKCSAQGQESPQPPVASETLMGEVSVKPEANPKASANPPKQSCSRKCLPAKGECSQNSHQVYAGDEKQIEPIQRNINGSFHVTPFAPELSCSSMPPNPPRQCKRLVKAEESQLTMGVAFLEPGFIQQRFMTDLGQASGSDAQ